MTDVQIPNPANTPPAGSGEPDTKWRDEYFKLKIERDNLNKINSELNQVNTDLSGKLKESSVQSEKVQSTSVELLRVKKAYAAGVPQHLLNLVTANSEAEIDSQIKTIVESLVGKSSQPVPVKEGEIQQTAPPTNQQSTVINPPPPSNIPAESWLSKYQKATPDEKDKMMREAKEQGKNFKLA